VPDDAIEQRLAVCEGIETALAAIRAGWPCWAAIDAGNMATLPAWPGIDITIFADHDENGAGQRAADAFARRWAEAGGWAEVITAGTLGADLNDLAREIAL
jgi:putative DNA primase/helicase